MAARTITDIEQLRELAGTEIGVSDWVEMTQERINTFADTTDDHQWIHIDRERAAAESPYGATIAHGFLTLSLLSALIKGVVVIDAGFNRAINYGLNRVRFPSAVPAGSKVRGRVGLKSVEDIEGGHQFVWDVHVEVEGSPKPAVVAEWVTRAYR